MNTKDAQIRVAAMHFRTAIEQIKGRLSTAFCDFPHGTCGDTSVLLGMYLEAQGFGKFQYVSGERHFKETYHGVEARYRSHAWLEQDGLIVDITADQYERDDPGLTELTPVESTTHYNPVLVTSFSEWHAGFEERSRHLAHARYYDARSQREYERLYAIIVRQIEQEPSDSSSSLPQDRQS